MTTSYILSQILVILAYIFLGIGLGKKSRKQILEYSTIYNILTTIHYILLSGIMGAIAGIIGLIRNLLFYYNEKRSIKNSKLILYVFCIISVTLTIVFYKTPVDILPCVLTLIGIYSYWNTNTKVTRIGNILISICYIIYAIPLKSYFSILLEGYLVVKTLIGYYKYETERKDTSK